jgi:hypothetical protein
VKIETSKEEGIKIKLRMRKGAEEEKERSPAELKKIVKSGVGKQKYVTF